MKKKKPKNRLDYRNRILSLILNNMKTLKEKALTRQ